MTDGAHGSTRTHLQGRRRFVSGARSPWRRALTAVGLAAALAQFQEEARGHPATEDVA